MDILFDNWNEKKKEINKIDSNIYFNQWEIWWVSLWKNIKNESFWKWENYRRPVLVLKKLSSESFIAIPLSTQKKIWTWFVTYDLHWVEYTALIYQIRMLHKNRLRKKLGQLDNFDYDKIKKSLANLLELS
jgi:mRNA interferase MazF